MALSDAVNLPHTVTVYPAQQVQEGDGDIRARSYSGSGTTIAALAWEESPEAAFRDFGVELRRPVRFICDPSHASAIEVGHRVVWGSRTLEVAAPPRTISAGLSVDNTDVLLRDGQFD